MAAARHGGLRGRDVAREREREIGLERSRRSKEYHHHHHRRHPSRDRDSDRRRDGGRSGGREPSGGYSRRRSPHPPPRSRPSGRVEDREPGELPSRSGSEESRGPSLNAREPRENDAVGDCRYGGSLSPSRKRKHSPVRDVNVSKLQATYSVRRLREVDTIATEFPQPSPPPLSDASTVATAGECSPMNFSYDAEQLLDHGKNEILEGEEECPMMRNILTSRWANAEEEEEVAVPKRKSSSLANSVEQRSTKRASSLEPGEVLGDNISGGNSSISPNSMVVQGSENEDLEVDKSDCMDVATEDNIDSPAGYLLDTDLDNDVRRSRTPENAQPSRRCINMLQSCRTIDEFERLNTINEGTYGVVFRVRDKKTDEVVALKKVKMDKEREGREGFPLTSLREINILLSLHHPSIVDVKEVVVGGRDNDDTFMVMEYMEHDLKGVMETMKQPYHQSEVKCLMLQLLEGVKYLHDNWVLHRDLKTSNLLLNNRGELKICDFGLSRQYGSPLKPYTQPVVTLWYRAPELLLGAKEYSTAIDMWSLGCIMAELLTKKSLFDGKSEIDQLDKIFRMLGAPNDEIWPGYSKLPGAKAKFVKQPRNRLREKFPAVSFTGGLTLSEAGFDLLTRLLTYDPEKRISADAALNHEWFREVPLPKTKDFMPTFRALNEQDRRFKQYVKSPDPLEEQLLKEQGSAWILNSGNAIFPYLASCMQPLFHCRVNSGTSGHVLICLHFKVCRSTSKFCIISTFCCLIFPFCLQELSEVKGSVPFAFRKEIDLLYGTQSLELQYYQDTEALKDLRGRVKWDEDNLNDIESNKPEREKITEPKTPYHTMSDDDEGSVSPRQSSEESVDKSAHADAIKSALDEAVSSGKIFKRESWEPCDSEEAVKQGTAFEEHRKVHYDEYHKMKELLQKGTTTDDADEGESDANNMKE
ncbi:hypothetical protein EJB05_20946 [Eragrostis curvula]|uniref:Protein kinase domain-containing protein n=1 Tax=Eragrostis curvula TaxID=38414 RepID=A0A5J9UZM6_9POAL|nr:hypothetical protein EJB05_20946 [Eragrostis curvula]